MKDYDFKAIEAKWQKYWTDTNYGIAEDFSDKPKFYSLIEFPYPSGSGLHVGHCMMYSAADAHARMMRMKGYNLMFPMGWDAFGLPTENYAIKNKVKPQIVTEQSVKTFKKQQQSIGYSFDWSREINTTDPNYYKWTQWIFLQFYKHAVVDGKLIEVTDDDTTTPRLAFQSEMPVNWCPSCKIVLANEEVINNNCERCGAGSQKRKQKQWMLRITDYADRLIKDLGTVDYLDKIKTQQINWIGKSVGSNIQFKIQNSELKINVFTTRADTLFGCTYIVIAPESDYIAMVKDQVSNIKEVEEYIKKAKSKSDIDRTDADKDKTGVKLEGIKAINPINDEEVDVYVADYVLASYGTGAVMAVPAHDDRDFAFAKKYGIEIKQVINEKIATSLSAPRNDDNQAFTDYGVLVNSGEFSGLTSEEAKTKITEKLKKDDLGDFTTNFKLRDWIFSRQHYWGEPIPIIHCDKCGIVPVPVDQLPVTLPDVENYEPTDTGESPLAKIDSWVNVKCPKCNSDAHRETDTMPNWAGSSWYFLRYCDPKNDQFFTKPTFFQPEIEVTEKDKKYIEEFKAIYTDLDQKGIKTWAANRFMLNGINRKVWLPLRTISVMGSLKDLPVVEKYVIDNNYKLETVYPYGKLFIKDDIRFEYVTFEEKDGKLISFSEKGAIQEMSKNDLPEFPLGVIDDFHYRVCSPEYNLKHYKFISKNESETRQGLGDEEKIKFLEEWLEANNSKRLYWTPVDLYNGGPEHITLHLLYSRFWHKFLYDLGVVPTLEPYQKRIQHGIILGPDGQKMSKSKGNVVNPDEMVEKFGADTLRAYMMFIGPYDQESAWNNAGIMGVHRFLKRVVANSEKVNVTKDTNDVLVKLNQTVAGVTDDLENFQMNTVISKLMELNNLFEKQEKISTESFKTFLQILYTACPHIASELWSEIDNTVSIEQTAWPVADEKYLLTDEVDIAVQINGKTRQIIKIKQNASQEEAENLAKADTKISELLNGQNIKKTVYVTGRILNFVLQ